MNDQNAFPLSWPPGRKRRRLPDRSRFKDIGFGRARDTLMHELWLLGAHRPILSTNIPLKQDGMPYATFAPPKDKGVAVYFKVREKPMVFACDEWDRIEHNVWAIAKTIEALRGIERWGSGEMLERAFSGFAALPSPERNRHWREVLGFTGVSRPTAEQLKQNRNEMAMRSHPDRGGSSERMAEVNRAYDEAMKEV